MEPLLDFFSGLMTITFGILTMLALIIVFILVVIEVLDNIREGKSTTLEIEED